MLALILASLVGFLGGAAVTGYDRRPYATVSATSEDDQTVTIAQQELPASELAARYHPITRLDPDQSTPPLLRTMFEVVDAGDDYVLLYHRVWADEVHPNPLINALYRAYRAAVYGYPTHDVERTAITVEKATGWLREVEFEGPAGQAYDAPTQPHATVSLTRQADGKYLRTDTSSAGQATNIVQLSTLDERLIQRNVTWNHLSDIGSAPAYSVGADEPLAPLTDDLYADGKYARKRPAGQYTTDEYLPDRWVASGLCFVAALAGLAAWAAALRSRP